jgi:hypothetical protein
LFSSTDIIREVGVISSMFEELIIQYKKVIGKHEGKRSLGEPKP